MKYAGLRHTGVLFYASGYQRNRRSNREGQLNHYRVCRGCFALEAECARTQPPDKTLKVSKRSADCGRTSILFERR